VSECKGPAADQSFEVSQVKSMNRHRLVSDWTQSEWKHVDLLDFLATTIDLRMVCSRLESRPFSPTNPSFREIRPSRAEYSAFWICERWAVNYTFKTSSTFSS